jgi:hypothetical protein
LINFKDLRKKFSLFLIVSIKLTKLLTNKMRLPCWPVEVKRRGSAVWSGELEGDSTSDRQQLATAAEMKQQV